MSKQDEQALRGMLNAVRHAGTPEERCKATVYLRFALIRHNRKTGERWRFNPQEVAVVSARGYHL